jgi:hypothetical protein
MKQKQRVELRRKKFKQEVQEELTRIEKRSESNKIRTQKWLQRRGWICVDTENQLWQKDNRIYNVKLAVKLQAIDDKVFREKTNAKGFKSF